MNDDGSDRFNSDEIGSVVNAISRCDKCNMVDVKEWTQTWHSKS